MHPNTLKTIQECRPKRRGRAKRTAKQASSKAPIIQRRDIPIYRLLSESGLSAIEAQADWLMENIGIEFRSDPVAIEREFAFYL